MQIHELNSFVGSPGTGDYLAIDDGTKTMKVDANNLGITTQMTVAEAEAGTVTAPRVIAPDVLNTFINDYVPPLVDAEAETFKVLVVTSGSFSVLPLDITNADISATQVVVHSVLSNPSAQTGDWTVTTADGSATVSGSISGSTTLTLYLMESR